MRKGYLLPLLLVMTLPLAAQQAQGLEPVPEGLKLSVSQANPRGIVTAEGAAPGNGSAKTSLPSRVDLREFLPPVRSQGSIGSCSAWSTVYYAKTLQENQERGWGADTPDHQYGPLFTYNQITGGVNRGTSIMDHMILLEKQGAAPFSLFPYEQDIHIQPDDRVIREAENFRAESHRNLDQYDSRRKTWLVELKAVKAALAEDLPVVAGFQIYENFYRYRGGIYDRVEGRSLGGHAMCIVGYDDKKGALLIVNSWGTDWGEEGFVWMDYDLFERLCTYNCAVMYDVVETAQDTLSAPSGFSGSQGAYLDRIELSWNRVDGADEYVVYRVDNGEGVLKEIGRTGEAGYVDGGLPGDVSYVYAVKSARGAGRWYGESGFSEIAEAWTGKQGNPPGIPSKLDYRFYLGNPVLAWEPVAEAGGYGIYRWSREKSSFLLVGRSEDAAFMDREFKQLTGGEVEYYIVQAFNDYGEGMATDSLAVLHGESASPEEEKTPVRVDGSQDDMVVALSEQKPFQGEYHRTDYFDYEYTMARFRDFYNREMEAFRDFQKKEMSDFEAWKKQNSWR